MDPTESDRLHHHLRSGRHRGALRSQYDCVLLPAEVEPAESGRRAADEDGDGHEAERCWGWWCCLTARVAAPAAGATADDNSDTDAGNPDGQQPTPMGVVGRSVCVSVCVGGL